MTNLDFSGPILDQKGNPQGATLGDLLSQLLMQSAIKPPMSAKFFSWAIDLAKTGQISVADDEKAVLLELVSNSDGLTVLGRGRLTEVFNPPATVVQMAPPAAEPVSEAVSPTPVLQVQDEAVAVETASSDPGINSAS